MKTNHKNNSIVKSLLIYIVVALVCTALFLGYQHGRSDKEKAKVEDTELAN